MKSAIEVSRLQQWKYVTDLKSGICILTNEPMRIKFKFGCVALEFPDVMEIEKAVNDLIKRPVSVEGAVDELMKILPQMHTILAYGRSDKHGWITAAAGSDANINFGWVQ